MKKRSRTRSFGAGTRISHDSSAYYGLKLYAGLAEHPEAGTASPENPFPGELVNRILTASSEDMSAIPDNCVHLMATSPPYNASKDYDALLNALEKLEKGIIEEEGRVLFSRYPFIIMEEPFEAKKKLDSSKKKLELITKNFKNGSNR